MPTLQEIITACLKHNPMDVLLIPGEPPILRIDGVLRKLPDAKPISPADCKHLIYSMIGERQQAKFEKTGELDCTYRFDERTQFRVNLYVQRLGIAAAMRVIPPIIPTPEQLGLTPNIMRMADLCNGLVLVSGPTGSGKSTTLASMIQYINERKNKHILTIEDPIEYIYQNKNSIIDQREVGEHTVSFAQALKHSLRQNPDIIMIGEMRDIDTMEMAIRAAETGHLCFSTLHTRDAASTINRIIAEFPIEQREKLCVQLARILTGVICQAMLPRKGGGLICAREVMLMNPAIETLIRDNKIHQIYGAIESSMGEGMCTIDQSLANLLKLDLITFEDAMVHSRNPKNLRALMAAAHAPPPASIPERKIEKLLNKKLF